MYKLAFPKIGMFYLKVFSPIGNTRSKCMRSFIGCDIFPDSALKKLNYINSLHAYSISHYLPILDFGGGGIKTNWTDAQLYLKTFKFCFLTVTLPHFQPTTVIHLPVRTLIFTSNNLHLVFYLEVMSESKLITFLDTFMFGI